MCPDLVNLLPVENGFRSIQVPWVQLYAAHGKTNPWHYLVYLMDMRSMTHSALGPIVYSKFSAICSASWRAFGLHLVLSPIPQVFVRALCSKNQTQNENGIYIYFTYQYHLLESSKPKHLQKSAATRSITFEIRSHWKTWTIHLNICIASRQPELLTFLWRLVRFYCKKPFRRIGSQTLNKWMCGRMAQNACGINMIALRHFRPVAGEWTRRHRNFAMFCQLQARKMRVDWCAWSHMMNNSRILKKASVFWATM